MIKQAMKAVLLAALVAGPALVWAGTAKLTAVAEMNPTDGNRVQGEIKFIQEKGYVLVKAYLENLTPGKHPFHVHEKGDCSAPDASSAGGHFNPEKGKVDAADLGKLEPDSHGKVHYTYKDKLISLTGPNSIIGHSVVIHASDSPARIACGVIQELHDNK